MAASGSGLTAPAAVVAFLQIRELQLAWLVGDGKPGAERTDSAALTKRTVSEVRLERQADRQAGK